MKFLKRVLVKKKDGQLLKKMEDLIINIYEVNLNTQEKIVILYKWITKKRENTIFMKKKKVSVNKQVSKRYPS